MVEALGLSLPHNAAIPAVDSRRYALAHLAGRRIVELVEQDVRISQILTREAFENAIRVNGAVGGSTNAVIHLLAMAGRVGVPLSLDDWDDLGRDVPTIVDLMPSGRFLMEDFYYAGGLPAVMRDARRARPAAPGRADGQRPDRVGELPRRADLQRRGDPAVRSSRWRRSGGIAVLRGNLAPDGAVLKPSAASPHLMQHRGRAVVFENIEHYNARIVRSRARRRRRLRAGAQETADRRAIRAWRRSATWACRPRCCRQGITDMVRISDARMSGTAYGTAVLHVSPEAAAGGPLALVRDGDMIELDVEARRLHLDVSDEELARAARRVAAAASRSCRPAATRSCTSSTCSRPTQGADLDFLVGCRGHDCRRGNRIESLTRSCPASGGPSESAAEAGQLTRTGELDS